ncbi:MAG: hypothetical protein EBX14_04180, partial [Proteobacteria bacterium]|nr:hypothetical protein [Pseudomonadota bacterium]
MKDFVNLAEKLELDYLIEVHDLDELKRVQAYKNAIIGVNNRNLKTFEVDLNNSINLREEFQADNIFVAESGIKNQSDIDLLKHLSRINISTIDSVKNIIEQFDASKTLLIVDECHKIGTEKRGEVLTNNWHATLGLSATPERDYDDNFYIIIRKILGDIIFDYDYIDAREDEVIVNFKLLYAYAAMTPDEEEKYKKFTKSIQRRAATIGGNDMNDYPLKMLIFNRARMVKNSVNRIPFGIELLQKHKRDSWIVFTENKKQAKEFNKIINTKGYKSAIYNTDLDNAEREENLNNFKNGN